MSKNKVSNRSLGYVWIGLLAFLFTGVSASVSSATVTKVGNGDDGADLESLSPITAGRIWDSRAGAIELLERLDIAGIPGLGLLIPEVENSRLMLAAADVHPIGDASGSLELSPDQHVVFARTFAEPYAATRFFPAAQELRTEQLIALHIHEALHRALPAELRENEDIVMHITMAITSPGASHDRVRHIASLYIPIDFANRRAPESFIGAKELSSSLKERAPTFALPPRSPSTFGYDFDAYNNSGSGVGNSGNLHGIRVSTSVGGFKSIGSFAAEPVFVARLKASQGIAGMGASSFDLAGRVEVNEEVVITPFIRFTAKPLDTATSSAYDRDVTSFGAVYRNETDKYYFEPSMVYSLPSTTQGLADSTTFKSILTLGARSGFRFGRFRIGEVAELHSSEGNEISSSSTYRSDVSPVWLESASMHPFRILVLGPEARYAGNRVQICLMAKWIINDTGASLSDLGDIVDRGAGRAGINSSLSMTF